MTAANAGEIGANSLKRGNQNSTSRRTPASQQTIIEARTMRLVP